MKNWIIMSLTAVYFSVDGIWAEGGMKLQN